MRNNFEQSNSKEPDLDWSQVRETVKMLNLTVAHVTNSIHDGEQSVGTLGSNFSSMGTDTFILKEIFENNKDNFTTEEFNLLQEKCGHLSSQIQESIIAFQFFDRISQQLDHVCFSLECLSEIVSDPSKIYQPYEWHALQNQIRSAYNMDRQREIFDEFMKGTPKEELIEKMKKTDFSEEISDVEMF